jgi:hypothetical protein
MTYTGRCPDEKAGANHSRHRGRRNRGDTSHVILRYEAGKPVGGVAKVGVAKIGVAKVGVAENGSFFGAWGGLGRRAGDILSASIALPAKPHRCLTA